MARVMATENTTLYNVGKKFSFLVIIVDKTCYRVNISDNKWEFVNTDDPGPYNKTIIMDGSTTITGAQLRKLYSTHIRKLKYHNQLLGANSASRDLVTSEKLAISSHHFLIMLLAMRKIFPSILSRSSNIAFA